MAGKYKYSTPRGAWRPPPRPLCGIFPFYRRDTKDKVKCWAKGIHTVNIYVFETLLFNSSFTR